MRNEQVCLFLRLMKMKNSLHKYDINRPRRRHEHKYSNNIKSVTVCRAGA